MREKDDKRRYDVVIVGGGPAGSALSIYLARAGLDVVLLEQAVFPRDKVCGDFVSPKGLKYLHGLGCMDAVRAHDLVPITRSAVYLDGELISEGRLPHLRGLPPHGLAIPRVVLDEIMFRRAAAVGAKTREGCRVEGFEVEDDAVRVACTERGRSRTVAARLIVGADGAQSAVARAAGMQMQDHRYVLASIRTYCEGLPLDRTVLAFEEDFFPGFAWIFPVRPTYANIGVGMVSEPLKKDGLRLKRFFDRARRLAERLAAERGARVEIGRTAGWPIKTYGGARRNYFDHGLLVGEAACFVDPISGEGIPLAMESAEIAAGVIEEAFARGDFSEAGLSIYETRWRDRYDADLAVSDLVVSMLRNRHLVKLWTASLEIMCKTAREDPDYALKTGGILAGLVPNREGFSLDVFLKSLLHTPAFWMEVAKIRPGSEIQDTIERAAESALRQMAAAGHMLADAEWVGAWAGEVAGKQRDVLRLLARAAGELGTPPLVWPETIAQEKEPVRLFPA